MELDRIKQVLESMVAEPGVIFDDCKHFVCYGFGLIGIRIAEDLYGSKSEFELARQPYQLLDLAVFHGWLDQKRHVGLMLDSRLMVHYIVGSGVARTDITRPEWQPPVLHRVGRHKSLAA